MNYQKFFGALSLCGLLVATASHAKSFVVEVSVNGQPRFEDCLVFATENRLHLTRGSLVLTWSPDLAAKDSGGFMATTDGADENTALRLALHGGVYGGRFIVANAVNNFGQTYVLMGRAESCDLEKAQSLSGYADYAAEPVDVFVPGSVIAAEKVQYPDLAAWLGNDQPCVYLSCEPIVPTTDESSERISAIPGGSFVVSMKPRLSLAKPLRDCWTFEETGTLRNRLGIELLWRLDLHNTDPNRFQSVGQTATQHGMAFHGRLTPEGEFVISGIRATGGKATEYTGRAFAVRGC